MERTVNAVGLAAVAGAQVNVGFELAGQRVTLRMDGTKMAVISHDGTFLRTLPCPRRVEMLACRAAGVGSARSADDVVAGRCVPDGSPHGARQVERTRCTHQGQPTRASAPVVEAEAWLALVGSSLAVMSLR